MKKDKKMKKYFSKHRKCILLQVVIFLLLLVFFNIQTKAKLIKSVEEMLIINANSMIEEIDEYLSGHDDEYTYRQMVSAYYSTYMNLQHLSNLTENDREKKRLDYLLEMNAVYDGLLSGEVIIVEDLEKIREAFVCIRDKDWKNEALLFDLFTKVRNEIEDRREE